MKFQMIVLTIAIIVLLVLLVIIGVSLSKASSGDNWPPVVGVCPDYWVDMSGNGDACSNTQSLGTCNIPSASSNATMNFNKSPFIGDNGTCSKYRWATACKVTWDGITSGVKNPCYKPVKKT
jgi:hypothetical protein